MIGEQGGLYKFKGHPEQAMVHDTVDPSELWFRRLAHVHYRALPIASKAIEGLPEFQAILREEQKSEYDLKKPVEECEDPKCIDHVVIRVPQIKNNLKR